LVIRFDPESRSFKQALIAIVFAGMYIEARLWIEGCRSLGKEAYAKIDPKPLEQRLHALGVTDHDLLEACKRYRHARKELVHEKAMPPARDDEPFRLAQSEAASAIELMDQLDAALIKLERRGEAP
jgi:hypothetical protein